MRKPVCKKPKGSGDKWPESQKEPTFGYPDTGGLRWSHPLYDNKKIMLQ